MLGSHEERFVAHSWVWSEQHYVDHWKHALVRALDGTPSALVTDMQTPDQSSHLVWWPVWKSSNELVFQNQLFFFAQYKINGSCIEVEQLYGLIGEHMSHDEEGVPLSEWRVPVSDVEEFLRSKSSDIRDK